MGSGGVDLGTYRTADGDLVHCWCDLSGALTAERDGPDGRTRIDPSVLAGAVKLSDDPLWPDREEPASVAMWEE